MPLSCLDKGPRQAGPYPVDVVFLIDDGERQEGAGIGGVVLRDEELEREIRRGWAGVGGQLPQKRGKGRAREGCSF